MVLGVLVGVVIIGCVGFLKNFWVIFDNINVFGLVMRVIFCL